MIWNIAPECVSMVVLTIIWIYSRKGNITPNLKNRLFQLCFFVTFVAMLSNILSTFLIYELNAFTIIPAWLCNTIYFLTTPLMGFVYYLYVLANVFENELFPKKLFLITILPAVLYIILVLINPWTHWIYHLNIELGYAKGSWIAVTYYIFYLYCLICFVLVVWKGHQVDKTVRKILFTFPVIAAIVIFIQSIFQDIILTGSAATIALLMIYLFMQNKQISIDYLTKLANRQEFLSILKFEIEKNDHMSFAVIVFSLREFKRINDLHGQLAGNAFLLSVSYYLKEEFKLNERQLFRYSGDEFAILVPYERREKVEFIVHTIQKRMETPWTAGNVTCMLYGALGIVEYPLCADSKEEIVNGIEFSVNLAKANRSSNHICYCTKEILERVHRRQIVADALRSCMENHNFELYYQPIYQIANGTYPTAEALLRIPNSPLGPLYPDEFIPVAEESGLIIELTYMVLEEVCHLLQYLKQQNIPVELINVNFSSTQFLQPDLMEKVIAILKEHDIDGSMIKIEITESTLSENADTMLNYANQMNQYGIRLALDDYGTGYSNTSSVLTYPIDTIKLDKSLLWSAMKDKRSALIVENLTKSFKDLGYTVLSEGVETIEQSRFVEACGCSSIQGYYYAKPMPKKEYIKFMKACDIAS